MVERELGATGIQRAGWKLVVAAVGLVAAAGCVVALDLGPMVDVSTTRLAGVVPGWVAFHVLFACAFAMGVRGLVAANRVCSNRWSRVSSWVAVAAAVAAAGTAVLRLTMLGADAGRLGDLATFTPALAASMVTVWLAAAATALTGVAGGRPGMLGRMGVVVAVLATTYLLADVVTGGAFPPFAVAVLWLVLGVSALVRRVPSA